MFFKRQLIRVGDYLLTFNGKPLEGLNKVECGRVLTQNVTDVELEILREKPGQSQSSYVTTHVDSIWTPFDSGWTEQRGKTDRLGATFDDIAIANKSVVDSVESRRLTSGSDAAVKRAPGELFAHDKLRWSCVSRRAADPNEHIGLSNEQMEDHKRKPTTSLTSADENETETGKARVELVTSVDHRRPEADRPIASLSNDYSVQEYDVTADKVSKNQTSRSNFALIDDRLLQITQRLASEAATASTLRSTTSSRNSISSVSPLPTSLRPVTRSKSDLTDWSTIKSEANDEADHHFVSKTGNSEHKPEVGLDEKEPKRVSESAKSLMLSDTFTFVDSDDNMADGDDKMMEISAKSDTQSVDGMSDVTESMFEFQSKLSADDSEDFVESSSAKTREDFASKLLLKGSHAIGDDENFQSVYIRSGRPLKVPCKYASLSALMNQPLAPLSHQLDESASVGSLVDIGRRQHDLLVTDETRLLSSDRLSGTTSAVDTNQTNLSDELSVINQPARTMSSRREPSGSNTPVTVATSVDGLNGRRFHLDMESVNFQPKTATKGGRPDLIAASTRPEHFSNVPQLPIGSTQSLVLTGQDKLEHWTRTPGSPTHRQSNVQMKSPRRVAEVSVDIDVPYSTMEQSSITDSRIVSMPDHRVLRGPWFGSTVVYVGPRRYKGYRHSHVTIDGDTSTAGERKRRFNRLKLHSSLVTIDNKAVVLASRVRSRSFLSVC